MKFFFWRVNILIVMVILFLVVVVKVIDGLFELGE